MYQVSRSFAVVVPCLETPLNHFMATAYLICRVADNIEDSRQPFAWQKKRFAEFLTLLNDPTLALDILAGWEQEAWPGLTPDEKRLMSSAGGSMLWQIYKLIPDRARATVCRWVAEMAQGMQRLAAPGQPPRFIQRQEVSVLASETDYNHYCYFVAGTVGHLATDLVIDHYQLPADVARRLLNGCEACGRGLQKTNIVKDFLKDLARGICYLPEAWLKEIDHLPLSLAGAPTVWKQKVLDNVLAELQDSVSYLLALPYSAVGYRLASLLCLLPAYQTILLAAQQQRDLFTADHQLKISRRVMAQCLTDAQALAADNQAIVRYSNQLNRAVAAEFEMHHISPTL